MPEKTLAEIAKEIKTTTGAKLAKATIEELAGLYSGSTDLAGDLDEHINELMDFRNEVARTLKEKAEAASNGAHSKFSVGGMQFIVSIRNGQHFVKRVGK